MVRRRTLVGTAGALLLGGCTSVLSSERGSGVPSQFDYSQMQFDAANSGAVPDIVSTDEIEADETTLSGSPVTSPIAVGGGVFFGIESGHIASSFDSNTPEWSRHASGGRRPTGTPAFDGQRLVVSEGANGDSGTALVRALDVGDGTERWRTPLAGAFALAPTVRGTTVFVRSETGVTALETETGDVLWQESLPAFEAEGLDVLKDISPAVDDERVYVPNRDGVAAFDAATGERTWSVDTEKVRASPTMADGIVLVPDVRNGVIAVDATDGEERWHWESSGVWSSPAVREASVYVVDGDAVELSADNGVPREEYDTPSDVFGSPLVTDGGLLVSSLTHTTLLDLSERSSRHWQVGVGGMMSPATDGKRVYVLSMAGGMTTVKST